jgi:hypothetical protein
VTWAARSCAAGRRAAVAAAEAVAAPKTGRLKTSRSQRGPAATGTAAAGRIAAGQAAAAAGTGVQSSPGSTAAVQVVQAERKTTVTAVAVAPTAVMPVAAGAAGAVTAERTTAGPGCAAAAAAGAGAVVRWSSAVVGVGSSPAVREAVGAAAAGAGRKAAVRTVAAGGTQGFVVEDVVGVVGVVAELMVPDPRKRMTGPVTWAHTHRRPTWRLYYSSKTSARAAVPMSIFFVWQWVFGSFGFWPFRACLTRLGVLGALASCARNSNSRLFNLAQRHSGWDDFAAFGGRCGPQCEFASIVQKQQLAPAWFVPVLP